MSCHNDWSVFHLANPAFSLFSVTTVQFPEAHCQKSQLSVIPTALSGGNNLQVIFPPLFIQHWASISPETIQRSKEIAVENETANTLSSWNLHSFRGWQTTTLTSMALSGQTLKRLAERAVWPVVTQKSHGCSVTRTGMGSFWIQMFIFSARDTLFSCLPH